MPLRNTIHFPPWAELDLNQLFSPVESFSEVFLPEKNPDLSVNVTSFSPWLQKDLPAIQESPSWTLWICAVSKPKSAAYLDSGLRHLAASVLVFKMLQNGTERRGLEVRFQKFLARRKTLETRRKVRLTHAYRRKSTRPMWTAPY